MSFTRRTRFEILRRDNYTCRYCGSKAPDVELQVDHVVPVALGGTDAPDNGVTACKDCNAGKASTSLADDEVEDVTEHAVEFQRNFETALREEAERIRAQKQYRSWFAQHWLETFGDDARLPNDWEKSLNRWFTIGVPWEIIEDAVDVVSARDEIKGWVPRFKYMCGIVWTVQKQAAERAHQQTETVGRWAGSFGVAP